MQKCIKLRDEESAPENVHTKINIWNQRHPKMGVDFYADFLEEEL